MSRSSFAGAGAAAALACLRMKPARLSGTEGAALAGPLETCVLDSMVGLVTASTRRGDGGLPACGARMVGGDARKVLRRLGNSQTESHKRCLWCLDSDGMRFQEDEEQPGWERQHAPLVLHDEHVAIAMEVADLKGMQLARLAFLLEGVGGRADLNLPDRIHPTVEGHKIVAENVWKYLRPVLQKLQG